MLEKTERRPLNQISIIFVLLLLIPLGLSTKFYQGPGWLWVQLYAGDIFYPMFWFFLVMLIFPRSNTVLVSFLVFLSSTIVEFSQLLHGPVLIYLRQSFLGRVLVGTSFVWWDILYYFIGCVLALFLYDALNFFCLPKTASEPERHKNPL